MNRRDDDPSREEGSRRDGRRRDDERRGDPAEAPPEGQGPPPGGGQRRDSGGSGAPRPGGNETPPPDGNQAPPPGGGGAPPPGGGGPAGGDDGSGSGATVALLVVAAVVGVVLFLAVAVIGSAVIGTFVLNLGGEVDEGVQAGASVSPDQAAGEVTVTWTSNQNAEYLVVEWSGQAEPVRTSDGASATGGGDAHLRDVGSSVTLGEEGSGDTTVEIRVYGVAGGDRTLLVEQTVEI